MFVQPSRPKRFRCASCVFATDDVPLFWTHVRKTHPDVYARVAVRER